MRDQDPGFTITDIIAQVGQEIGAQQEMIALRGRQEYTAREIADALGIPVRLARDVIRSLIKRGVAEQVWALIDFGLGKTVVRAYRLRGRQENEQDQAGLHRRQPGD